MFEIRSRFLGHDIISQSVDDLAIAKEHAEVKRKSTGEHYYVYEVKLVWTTQTVDDLIKEVKF